MTRLQRLTPTLLAAFMAACAQAPLPPHGSLPGQEVVVSGSVLGGASFRVQLNPPGPTYALADVAASTVHRWVAADIVRYDLELRVRNASSGFDALNPAITAQVPVGSTGAGSANFTNLAAGSYYRAYVKAMGKVGGASGSGEPLQINASASADHADFDFTGSNDLVPQVNRTVTVTLDSVAFSGTGALSFGSPVPGGYASPSGAPTITAIFPSVAPSVAPSASALVAGTFTVGSNPYAVAVDMQGNAWVANNGSSNLTKLASNGSVLATYTVGSGPRDVKVDAQNNVWVALRNGSKVLKLNSNGSILGSFTMSSAHRLAIDSQGNVWVHNTNGVVTKLNSSAGLVGSYSVGNTPDGMALDGQDNLWVANNGSNNITKLASNGSALATYPLANGPTALVVDGQGNVWVSTFGDNKVVKLSSSGSLLGSFDGGNMPTSLALGLNGEVWVSAFSGNQVLRLASSGSLLGTYATGTNPRRLVVATSGQVWVPNEGSGTVTGIVP